MVVKVLHTADWHLGRRFRGFREHDELELSRARFLAIERIFALAIQHQVDAVLCAGDLFDAPLPKERHWHALVELFAKHADKLPATYLLPGNHDALTASSLYREGSEFRRLLPDSVRVVDRPNSEFTINDEAVLYATPCQSHAGELDLAMRLPAREEGDTRVRIGMVHGQTFDMPGHQTNFPIDPEAVRVRGFDYLALGDTHAYRVLASAGDDKDAPRAPVVYPGSPEPNTFGEPGAGHVALVFFPRDRGRRPIVRRERVGRFTWRDETVRSLTALRTIATESLADTVLRLRVEATLDAPSHHEATRLLEGIAGDDTARGSAAVAMIKTEQLQLDTQEFAWVDALPESLRETANRLRALANGEDGATARRALLHLHRLAGQ